LFRPGLCSQQLRVAQQAVSQTGQLHLAFRRFPNVMQPIDLRRVVTKTFGCLVNQAGRRHDCMSLFTAFESYLFYLGVSFLAYQWFG
jgi:hypothetical protein